MTMSAAAVPARRRKPGNALPALVGFGSFAGFFLLVELLIQIGVLNRFIIPPPSEIIESFPRIIVEEHVLSRFVMTLTECLTAGVMLTVFGRELEIVNVDDQQRLRCLVPEYARPLFGSACKSDGREFALAVFFPESTCVGVAVDGAKINLTTGLRNLPFQCFGRRFSGKVTQVSVPRRRDCV